MFEQKRFVAIISLNKRDKVQIHHFTAGGVLKMNSSIFLLFLLPLQALGKNLLESGKNETRKGPTLPYFASIFIDDAWFCAGTFILTRHILTSAHCVDGGTYFDVSLGGQEQSSIDAVIHPNYNPTTFSADLAVIRLPLNPNVESATLPSRGEVLQEGDSVCMDNLDDTFVCRPVMSDLDCNAVFGPEDIVCVEQSHGELCDAVNSGAPGVVADDGGPWTLAGVMALSSSAGCEVGLPVGFTRLENYIDWINGL